MIYYSRVHMEQSCRQLELKFLNK